MAHLLQDDRWSGRYGLRRIDGGVEAAWPAADATVLFLCLFDADGTLTGRFALPHRTGDTHHARFGGIVPGQLYGLMAEGPFDPARGLRHDGAKLLADPFARAIDRPFRLDSAMLRLGAPTLDTMPRCRFIEPATAPDNRPRRPWRESVIYEMHVKGFSQRLPGLPENLRGRFAALAHPAALIISGRSA